MSLTREEILEMMDLSPKRRLHTLGVEQEAKTLALRWGADAERASQAALLHDITKEMNKRLKNDGKCVIPDINFVSLRHAETGALLAESLGASPEVVLAVRWHTTGRPGMGVLEKIIYLADKIEPFRSKGNQLAGLRRLAYQNLDRAVLLAMDDVLIHLIASGKAINTDTILARNEMLKSSG